MASFSDLFKSGWSTSRPGDMKNGMGAEQLGGHRPSPAEQRAKEAMAKKTAELAEKQRAFFASISKAKAESESRSPFTIDPALVRDAAVSSERDAIFGGYNSDHDALRREAMGLPPRREAIEPPNPDRPQTAVDAW